MKVGLALSGGVARGPAHVGVLSVLEDAGIPIHCVAGSSAGSLVGAAYCAGLDMDQLRQLGPQFKWRKLARFSMPGRGFLTFAPLEQFVKEMLGDINIEALSKPYAANATDILLGEPILLKQGSVARAIHASSAVPGLVKPVEINGRLLCDGGVTNNCPVDAVRELGADYVIAVDLFAPSKPRFGPLGMIITSIESLVRSSGGGLKSADCLIKPDLSGKSYFNFSKSDDYFRLGELAAKAALAKIQRDIR